MTDNIFHVDGGNNFKVEVDKAAMEPNEYFKVLKKTKKKIDITQLQSQLTAIADYIIKAKELGQTALLDRLSFTYDAIIREQTLLANGFDKFVYEEDITKFLKNTSNIKLIELERYPRPIPNVNMKDIKKVKDLGVIEKFCVMFTDYSDADYKTPAETEKVKRNRDPIVFAYFRNDRTGIKHDRFYFITDWEDEECDLTFSALMKKMSEAGMEKVEHTISTDVAYVDEIVKATLENMNNPRKVRFLEPAKKSFWEKLLFWKK